MCNLRSSKKITIGIRTFRVDNCMENLIKLINSTWTTLACCCGHNRYPMSIVIEVGNRRYEVCSGQEIPRKVKFYKMDKKGFYYIPEAMEELK